MNEKSEVRIKCGQIFILSTDYYFLLVCEYCENVFYTLEDLRAHLNEHLILPTIVKFEESFRCGGSDSESIPPIEFKYVPTTILHDTTDNYKLEDNLTLQSSIATEDSDYSTVDIKTEHTEILQKLQPKNNKTQAKTKRRNDAINKTKNIQSHCYQCHICSKMISSASHLKVHIRYHTGDLQHECPVCKKRYINKSVLDVHTREKHLPDTDPRRFFVCDLCDVKLPTYSKLSRHRQTHRKDFVIKDLREERVQRYAQHKINESYKNRFDGRNDLMEPNQCHICYKTLSKNSSLKNHIRLHTGNFLHECAVCEKKFIKKFKLDIHVREKHLPDSDPQRYFPCELCHIKLKSLHQLDRHKKIHRGEPVNFTCEYCQKEFKVKGNLIRHMNIHSGIKPYKCDYCCKSYARNASKVRHEWHCDSNFNSVKKIEILDNIPPGTEYRGYFQCGLCDVKFNSFAKFKFHRESHTQKPAIFTGFTCDYCLKQFTKKGVLVQHMRIHSGIRPSHEMNMRYKKGAYILS